MKKRTRDAMCPKPTPRPIDLETVRAFGPDQDAWINSCLGWTNDEWWALAHGYRKAADLLVDHLIGTQRDMDALVYPVIFLYRQHLELLLKRIINRGALLDISENPHPAGHDLKGLWGQARKVIAGAWKTPTKEGRQALRRVECLIEEFHSEDPGSVTFRYSTDREGRQFRRSSRVINLRRLRQHVVPVSETLEGCATGLDEYVDTLADAKAACS